MFSHLFQKFVDIPRRFHHDYSKYNLDGRYFTSDVAKYILWYCHARHYIAKQEDLQTILYILQLYFLKEKHKALFMGDFVARSTGPVVPDISLIYLCGNETTLFDDAQPIEFHAEARPVELFSEETENIIEIIIDSYFTTGPEKRLRLAQRDGGAWEIVYNKGKGFGQFISKKKIAEESQKLKHWGENSAELAKP